MELRLGNHPAGQVLAMGEVLIDLIATEPATGLGDAETLAVRPGGAPANVAVALARLGQPAAFCGVVGTDPFGGRLRGRLGHEGVDTSRLRSTPEADTTLAFAWKDERGDGHFRLLRLADRLLNDADVDAAGIADLAALVVGSVALSAEPSRGAVTRAVRLAAEAGVPVAFDVNLRPTLWPDLAAARAACDPILARATLVKLSLDDARALELAATGAMAADPAAVVDRLLASFGPGRQVPARRPEAGAPIVVVTDGARGCWYTAADGAVKHVPAFRVQAVEPTGAGDAFTAALLVRLLANGWAAPDEQDVRYAAAAGALATLRPGAMDGLPTAAELEAFLARQAG